MDPAVYNWLSIPQYGPMVAMEKNDTVPKITLKSLETRTTDELRNLYESIISELLPHRASRGFLMGSLAWSIQAEKLKLNPAKIRKELTKQSSKATDEPQNKNRPGTCLIREWHGRVFEVTILKKGYMWDEKIYRSLTHIATDITGTRRSGPLFFGLRKRP